MSDSLDTFDDLATNLGLNQAEEDDAPLSTYWGHTDGDVLGAAIVDRFDRHRQWLQSNGLLEGWRIKLHYFHSEFRSDPENPHLNVMTQFGSQGEYSYLSVNHLRSILKTLLGSTVQNPPAFKPTATNADASSLEAASLYQGVLDYYTRELRLNAKIAKAVEHGVVVDNGFMLVEWDAFATDGDATAQAGIWKGAPSVKALFPWDVAYDLCKSSWEDLDWIVVRDWVDREKCLAQFPEHADDIKASQSRAVVTQGAAAIEPSRYSLNSYPDMSNDIQVYKFYHRPTAYMPGGRFCMALENGKLIFESPVGLVYPRLPVERFVCDEQTDILLGHSPINELLGLNEAINTIQSAITTNAVNYGNQYVSVATGTQINPRTLSDGQKILEYPPGSQPPVGLNLTAIPSTLFEHVGNLANFMQTLASVSNSSRGQTGGANQTSASMSFLQQQASSSQGNISQNYQDFASSVMTSLLHTLRVFARTPKTIRIMGKTVASKTIVLATALEDFDSVIVEETNPLLNTAQGKLQWAGQMLQWGNATPAQAQQVATSGNLGPAQDPGREDQFELDLENEALLDGRQVLVSALDNHETHVAAHKRLLSVPYLRFPDIAEKLGITNAPALMQNVMQHIQEHMQMLAQSQGNTAAATAGTTPGQPQSAPSSALGHAPQRPLPPPHPGAAPPQANGAGGQPQPAGNAAPPSAMPH